MVRDQKQEEGFPAGKCKGSAGGRLVAVLATGGRIVGRPAARPYHVTAVQRPVLDAILAVLRRCHRVEIRNRIWIWSFLVQE